MPNEYTDGHAGTYSFTEMDCLSFPFLARLLSHQIRWCRGALGNALADVFSATEHDKSKACIGLRLGRFADNWIDMCMEWTVPTEYPVVFFHLSHLFDDNQIQKDTAQSARKRGWSFIPRFSKFLL
jgi:hypothetical protein